MSVFEAAIDASSGCAVTMSAEIGSIFPDLEVEGRISELAVVSEIRSSRALILCPFPNRSMTNAGRLSDFASFNAGQLGQLTLLISVFSSSFRSSSPAFPNPTASCLRTKLEAYLLMPRAY